MIELCKRGVCAGSLELRCRGSIFTKSFFVFVFVFVFVVLVGFVSFFMVWFILLELVA